MQLDPVENYDMISTPPVRILFTIPNFITAGSGRVMINILERLDPEKFSPWVCVLRRGGGLEQELESRRIPLLELPFTVPVRPYPALPWRAWQASKAFRFHGFKIWHSFHYAADYSEPLIARLSGAAWVYTKKSMSWGSRAWRVRSWLAKRIVVDNSEMEEKFFAPLGIAGKVRQIYHGLPLEEFNPGVPPRLGLRRQFGIPSEAALVGCVAQLVPVKDHPNLIRAAAGIPGVHFLLAGSTTDAAYQEQLRSQAHSLGLADRLHFCGNVRDIPGFLSELDIFVLGGRMEGCPVALLEGMASGKACIATDTPGSRDLIISGKNGLLVPPGNPEALADAIRTLTRDADLRCRFGEAARTRAEEHFSIHREVADHETLYREILEEAGIW